MHKTAREQIQEVALRCGHILGTPFGAGGGVGLGMGWTRELGGRVGVSHAEVSS